MRSGDLMTDRFSDTPYFVLCRPDFDGDVDVHARTARRFDVWLHAEAFQYVAHDERALAHDRERRAFHRIHVEMNVQRAVGIVAQRVPGIEVDATEIDQPEQRRAVVDDRKIDDVTRPM